MNFDFLYNPDNEMCFSWSRFLEEGRRDLVPITASELSALKSGARIADIIRARANAENAEVSIVVPTAESNNAENDTAAADADTPKGVVVTGKKVKIPPPPEKDLFGNEKKDYTVLRGKVVVDDVNSVPNEDLVRFVKESVGKDYGLPPDGTEDEVSNWYAEIRTKAKRLIGRVVRNRIERAKLNTTTKED